MKTIKYLVLTALLAAVAMLTVKTTQFTTAAASQEEKSKVIVLSKSNLVVLNEEVTGESAGRVVSEAKELDADKSIKGKLGFSSKEPIYVFLFTPGGSIQSGLEMIEGLKGINRPVHTVTSFAASMGFQIAQNLGDRLILQSGVMMSHMAAGGAEGYFNGTADSQLRRRLALWESRIKELDEQTVKRTKGKQTMESYLKSYSPELWLTGSQSVESGYSDTIVTVRCDKTLDGYTTHSILLMGLIPVSYDLSDCPLNSTPTNVRVAVDTNKGRMTLQDFQSKAGGFGVTCYQLAMLDNQKVCATETALTIEKLNSAKSLLLDRYTNIRNYTIPMSAR